MTMIQAYIRFVRMDDFFLREMTDDAYTDDEIVDEEDKA